MYFTTAPESFRDARIFWAPAPGSITAASRLDSSTRRYASFLRGGTVNEVTRIAREEPSAGDKPAVLPPSLGPHERFSEAAPSRRGEAGMARKPGAAAAVGKVAKQILVTRWGFHPTTAAGVGLPQYDGLLPSYSPAAPQRPTAPIPK